MHNLHQLVLQSPGCAVTDADPAHKFQCRDTGFGLRQKEQRLKPDRQRQFGRVKNRSAGQGHLFMAAVTLKSFDPTMPDGAMATALAAWTSKTLWPASFFKRSLTLLVGSVVT